ncbi:MAG: nucleotide exchange factor GrpE [Nitrospinae bacterium]|nr:nucleotide exchange factor GrpE [Nitrospinota bacterium]
MAERDEPIHADPVGDAGARESQHAGDHPRFTVVDKRSWVTREKEDNGQATGTDAPPVRLPTYLEQLQAQLQEKDRLLKTHLAELRHEQEEVRRRLARDLEQRVEHATGMLLTDFLPVLDNMERALEAAEQQPNLAALLEGVRLVRTQFLNVLGHHGLTPLNRQGQPFDPSLDEAVAMLEVTEASQDNLVLQEWEKGYTLREKVLRPAKVAVGKLPAEDS